MTVLLTGLVSFLVFGTVILVHELGHFLAARRCGIRVQEFSIGFGPALYSKTKNGTTYTLRLLPLGGYNLFTAPPDFEECEEENAVGQSPQELLPQNPTPAPVRGSLFPIVVAGQDYEQAGPWQRFYVTLCGALMNFVLGAVVLLVLVLGNVQGSTTVAMFSPTATSSAGGLAEGDTILQVDGIGCRTLNQMAAAIGSSKEPRTLTVLRDGEVVVLPGITISPTYADGQIAYNFDFNVERLPKTPRNVLRSVGEMFGYFSGAILGGFADLITGRVGTEELSGPVGVVSAVGQAVSIGWWYVLQLMALLSINLGIFNLLPIPALDGCKLLFFAFEGMTGRAVPQRVQVAVNTVGLTLLVWLMLFVTMQDIGRFFG